MQTDNVLTSEQTNYKFDIVKKSNVKPTFRVSKIMADFDVHSDHATEQFKGEIILPESWSIGMIVGGSGTGKSTIGFELFGNAMLDNFEYTSASVIDDMPKGDVEEIERMFYTVGFSSVPSWLKPYSVLSNGEKMRVDLARKMLASDVIVFDEFTSVVDRQVAKVMSIAISKALKHYPNKKFVAIGCHYDVVEFLQPDWLFNTDEMKQVFQYPHDPNKPSQFENAVVTSGVNLGVITI